MSDPHAKEVNNKEVANTYVVKTTQGCVVLLKLSYCRVLSDT